MPSLGDLPNPGIEPESPALQVDSLPTELSEKLPEQGAAAAAKSLQSGPTPCGERRDEGGGRQKTGRRQVEEPERWPEAGTGEKDQRLWRKVTTACGCDMNLSGLLSEIVRKFSYTNRSSGGVVCGSQGRASFQP